VNVVLSECEQLPVGSQAVQTLVGQLAEDRRGSGL
jgi:hypothetical protein